jgi:ABC-2 type transport system permease protein
MVATLLKLRFRVLGNQLARSPWQLIGFLFGALYGLFVLTGAVIGLVLLAGAELEIASAVIVGVGSLITLGWVIGPLLVAGVDTTLDPDRLVVFPMTLDRMMVALTLAGICGIPGIVTSLASLATIATWVRSPASILAWAVAVPLAVLTAVVASRAVASLTVTLSAGRRFREISGILIFIPLMLAGPIIAGIASGFALNLDTVATIVRVLGWTPIGAAWALPGDAAAGDWAAAGAKLVIALATLALLWFVWRRALADALVRPRQAARVSAKPGALGWFGRVPTGGTGAIFARALTYWLRDPRYLRQLIVVPLVPVLLWFYARGGDPFGALSFSALLIALFIGIVIYADVSYDGTAYGTELATGVSGRADRVGRTLAAAALAVPLTVIAAVVPFAASGDWTQFPGILGMSLGVLAISYGVCAVTSAQLIVAVPAAGDNPFKRVPGATFLQGLAFLGIWLVALALAAPSVIVGLVAFFTGNAGLSWVAGAVGVVMGAVVLVIGIGVGGRMLDRTGPVLLSRLKAMRNA